MAVYGVERPHADVVPAFAVPVGGDEGQLDRVD
jgi:hypothetical protein